MIGRPWPHSAMKAVGRPPMFRLTVNPSAAHSFACRSQANDSVSAVCGCSQISSDTAVKRRCRSSSHSAISALVAIAFPPAIAAIGQPTRSLGLVPRVAPQPAPKPSARHNTTAFARTAHHHPTIPSFVWWDDWIHYSRACKLFRSHSVRTLLERRDANASGGVACYYDAHALAASAGSGRGAIAERDAGYHSGARLDTRRRQQRLCLRWSQRAPANGDGVADEDNDSPGCPPARQPEPDRDNRALRSGG